MRKIFVVLTLATAAVFGVAAPAAALPQPTNGSPVVDDAGILTPAQEADITAQIASIQKETGHEVAVLTVTDLGGESIEDFSLKVANDWGVGSASANDGVLLTVAMEERELRIEVGSGINDVLTDAVAAGIIDNTITPQMREGQYFTAIDSGVEAIGGSFTNPSAPAETHSINWVMVTLCGGAIVFLLVGVFVGDLLHKKRTLKKEAEALAAQQEKRRLKLKREVEMERERAAERRAYLQTPKGQREEAYRKKAAKLAAEKAAEARAKKNAVDAEAREVYKKLSPETLKAIREAKKRDRPALLQSELARMEQSGSFKNSSTDLLNAIVLFSVFTQADAGSSYPRSVSSTPKSTDSGYSGSSSPGSSSFDGGSFDGGGASGGW